MNNTSIKSNIHYDVLVIGGGLVGMLTARELNKKGYRVAIVEKNQLGKEASWAAGGILSPLYPWKQDPASMLLIKQGQTQFPTLVYELLEETHIDSELIKSGMIVLDEKEKIDAQCWANSNDECIQMITKNEIPGFEPNLSQNINEAIYLPEIYQVRPPLLIKAITNSLIKNQITLFEFSTVKELLIDTDKIRGVITKHSKLYASSVIMCSGAWTSNLLSTKLSSHTDISPVRGQMLLYKTKDTLLSHVILKNGAYLIPRNDGHLLCGSTIEHVGFDNDITDEAQTILKSVAEEICPEIKKFMPIKQWSALRPGTSRNVPYICEHPDIRGLYINSGHYRYGILMSIASAQIMNELISNTIDPLEMARFAY